MKKWFVPLLSLMAALVLFMTFSLFFDQNIPELPKLEKPVQIIMKSRERKPMDFWEVATRGIVEAAREYGLEYEISGPHFEKEIDLQIEIVNKIIEQRPPLILLAATDYKRLVPSVERASELGIPVITFDSAVDSTIPVSFVATDNIEAGEKAGREMKRLIAPRTRKEIAIVSHIKETATAIDREAGVRNALEGETIIGTWFIDVEQEKAYRTTLELLKNSNLGGIVALNEAAALGVGDAIAEKGAQDEVLVVGFDNATQELAYLEAGVIDALVVQRPYNMGYMSVKSAAEFLLGNPIPSFIDTGSILITRENMFSREYQELLFPVQNAGHPE